MQNYFQQQQQQPNYSMEWGYNYGGQPGWTYSNNTTATTPWQANNFFAQYGTQYNAFQPYQQQQPAQYAAPKTWYDVKMYQSMYEQYAQQVLQMQQQQQQQQQQQLAAAAAFSASEFPMKQSSDSKPDYNSPAKRLRREGHVNGVVEREDETKAAARILFSLRDHIWNEQDDDQEIIMVEETTTTSSTTAAPAVHEFLDFVKEVTKSEDPQGPSPAAAATTTTATMEHPSPTESITSTASTTTATAAATLATSPKKISIQSILD